MTLNRQPTDSLPFGLVRATSFETLFALVVVTSERQFRLLLVRDDDQIAENDSRPGFFWVPFGIIPRNHADDFTLKEQVFFKTNDIPLLGLTGKDMFLVKKPECIGTPVSSGN
jgi:hypothetical protein